MGEVLKQCETRTYWVVVEARWDGQWIQHGYLQETHEDGAKKLRWLRRWHKDAFLVSMVMTQCDSVSPKLPLDRDPESPGPQPTGRPQLRLV
jgi:hypothetical protein